MVEKHWEVPRKERFGGLGKLFQARSSSIPTREGPLSLVVLLVYCEHVAEGRFAVGLHL